jgi:tetratricopeptide (TPR) repeat protein
MVGNYAQAKTLMQQSAEMLRAVGDQHYMAMTLTFLGNTVTQMGELAAAKDLLEESLAISRALGDRYSQALCLTNLGAVTFLMGAAAWPEAKRLNQEGLIISEELGDWRNSAISLNHLGQIAYAQGHLGEAKQYFLTGLKTAMAGQVTPVALDALVGLLTLQVSQEFEAADSGPVLQEKAAETLAMVLNHPTTMHETKEKADRLLTELESVLPPEVVDRALARSATHTLAAAVAVVLAEMSPLFYLIMPKEIRRLEIFSPIS